MHTLTVKPAHPDLSAARIVVIDDDAANLKLAAAMLKSGGYINVVLVQDPRQALEKLNLAPTSLVLLDLNMPHLDGYAVLDLMRQRHDPLPPPVLVLTAQNSQDHVVRALSAGARDFVSKPFDRAELLMRVRNLLEAHLAHRMLAEQHTVLESMVALRTAELQASQLEVVHRLGRAAEFRDPETGNHILRMSHMSAALARQVGWCPVQCELLLHAAPLHDVGKIGIPDHVLLKPGPLDAAEWDLMKTHTTIGARIMEGSGSALLEMGATVALSHHERWDGNGYPGGLAGPAIPMAGRICALADVFDALTSVRPYKKAWPAQEALQHIEQQAGKHFDPQLTALFTAHASEMLDIKAHFMDQGGRA